MKIGIITHPLSYNYGGSLQNYALQTILKRMGHEPITLNPDPHRPIQLLKWIVEFPKKFAIKYFLGYRKLRLFDMFVANKNWRTIMQHLQPFIDEHINYINVKDYNTLNPDSFDALIAGSDQIWRAPYVTPIQKAYFNFAKDWNVKRLSYAASFGTDEWEYTPEQTAECKDLVQKFDGVSVREQSGVNLCKEYLGVDALHLLDPTMLLSADDYIALFQEKNTPKSPGTLLNYILDESEDKDALVEKMAFDNKLIPFRVNGKPETGYHIQERIQPSMEQWLRGFFDAKLVITDSFHACVFSIIFNKPFVVYANKQRGYARFQSLLSMFGLEDRIVYSLSDYKAIPTTINWNEVNRIFDQKRTESLNFLNSFLQ